jgi:hypothetical protein
MHVFSRRSASDGERVAIQKFWSWWARARHRIAAQFDADEVTQLSRDVNFAVQAIHRDLTWEVGPGLIAPRQLCISGEGSLERRALTGRLISAAPPRDGEWEYFPARQRKPDLTFSVQVGRTSVAASETRFQKEVDTSRERLDTTIWNPAFADLRDQERKRIAMLFVDCILGEDDVEKWVGGIHVESDEPHTSVDAAGFRAAVEALEASATGEQWVLAEAGRKGRPLVVCINTALKPIDHLDKQVRLDIWIEARNLQDRRMPSSEETAAWSDWEQLVETKLSDSIALGRVTGDGRRRITWHVVDGAAARSVVSELATQLNWKASISTQRDPGWRAFRANLLD